METINQVLGILSTIIAYVLLGKITYRDTSEDISFSSFFLWAILDGITAITMYMKSDGGFEWLLPVFFVFGSSSIAVILFLQRGWSWSPFEWIITVLIAICCCVWYTSGETNATIAATIAVGLAGIPQAVKLWISPSRKILPSWTFFFLGNTLFFFSDTSTVWEPFVHNRLCALINGLMALIVIIITLVRKPTKHRPYFMK